MSDSRTPEEVLREALNDVYGRPHTAALAALDQLLQERDALRAEVERLTAERDLHEEAWLAEGRAVERYRQALRGSDIYCLCDTYPNDPHGVFEDDYSGCLTRAALSGSIDPVWGAGGIPDALVEAQMESIRHHGEPPKRCSVCGTGLSASRQGCPYHPMLAPTPEQKAAYLRQQSGPTVALEDDVRCPTCGSPEKETYLRPCMYRVHPLDPWHRTTEEGRDE